MGGKRNPIRHIKLQKYLIIRFNTIIFLKIQIYLDVLRILKYVFKELFENFY